MPEGRKIQAMITAAANDAYNFRRGHSPAIETPTRAKATAATKPSRARKSDKD